MQTVSCVFIIIFPMQALAIHLKRRNLKILQQELSLPKIPEKVSMHFPQTSARSRKPKQPAKYVSQTTLSPEEEHIQDQLRMVLHREAKVHQQYARTPQLGNKHQGKKAKSLLPKIKNMHETSHKQISAYHLEDKERHQVNKIRNVRSQNTKFNLDQIFRNQSEFIENYFADISAKAKR